MSRHFESNSNYIQTLLSGGSSVELTHNQPVEFLMLVFDAPR